MKPKYFKDQSGFRKWLKENHDKKTELILGLYKKASGKQNLTWSQAVDEALCYGWIDGVTRSVDGDRYAIRFTPRRRNRNWSLVNLKKMKMLIKNGLMQEPGLKIFKARDKVKARVYSFENADKALAPEYLKKFRSDKKAWKFFSTQAPSYRKMVIHWVMTAKQAETRQRRLQKAIDGSAGERRIM